MRDTGYIGVVVGVLTLLVGAEMKGWVSDPLRLARELREAPALALMQSRLPRQQAGLLADETPLPSVQERLSLDSSVEYALLTEDLVPAEAWSLASWASRRPSTVR